MKKLTNLPKPPNPGEENLTLNMEVLIDIIFGKQPSDFLRSKRSYKTSANSDLDLYL